ncbi:hypothetical protein ALC56_11919 [Trachymyrmex septentrionalis]|uniref:Uncharacterized protein n=1 Tax=Trachymyrmex septentrionalis TaxID=34720 RepID=A0A195F0H6_9HYME|nr:hypothetical protein ALC56_11919 [Trachymyrmex septentrionalis]
MVNAFGGAIISTERLLIAENRGCWNRWNSKVPYKNGTSSESTHGDFHGSAERIETSLLSNEVCRRRRVCRLGNRDGVGTVRCLFSQDDDDDDDDDDDEDDDDDVVPGTKL